MKNVKNGILFRYYTGSDSGRNAVRNLLENLQYIKTNYFDLGAWANFKFNPFVENHVLFYSLLYSSALITSNLFFHALNSVFSYNEKIIYITIFYNAQFHLNPCPRILNTWQMDMNNTYLQNNSVIIQNKGFWV